MSRVSTRVLVVTGLLVALLLAGVVSYYASTSPDGLNRVAEDKGFSGTAKKHVSDDSPLAGYGTRGVSDERLSGGVAGVVGCLVVLVLAGGLALVVRRRGTAPGDDSDAKQPADHEGG
jgi:cobalt/nickel transport system permease protein/cobalt/nickel transport protein